MYKLAPPPGSDFRLSRRTSLIGLGGFVGFLLPRSAAALEPEVPVRIQVSLLNRVIPFDRKFAIRVHGTLSVVVVVDDHDIDSVRVGAQLLSELTSLDSLGSFEHHATRVTFSSAQALSDECRRLQAGVVYVTPGLREPTIKVAEALQGLKVLSVATLPEQVAQGLVLGSSARSGKPRVLVNLKQAKLQEIDFRADFLRMVEVIG